MTQQVVTFCEEYQSALVRKINEFAKTHHIESISYSVASAGYSHWHYACVLYTQGGNLNE